MINKKLLEILACPETKEALSLASPEIIDQLNKQIESGKILNRKGETVTEVLSGGLIRNDQKYLYPIRNDIPVMLIEEAIPL